MNRIAFLPPFLPPVKNIQDGAASAEIIADQTQETHHFPELLGRKFMIVHPFELGGAPREINRHAQHLSTTKAAFLEPKLSVLHNAKVHAEDRAPSAT